MANDDKISPNLPREGPNFYSRLTAHQLGDRIETQLPQSGNTLVEHNDEGVFHLNGRSRVGCVSHQQCTGVEDDG